MVSQGSTSATTTDLTQKHCQPCEGGVAPLPQADVSRQLQGLPGWECREREIRKTYRFPDFHQTMAFVNAVAWIAHQENHHPDLEVGYDHCTVRYSTHASNGVTENDLICAAKVEKLLSA